MAKLTFALEDGQEVVTSLADRLTIGRGEGNDVVVNDEGLSKEHAELRQNPDGSYEVLDLDSATGTFVNGQRVQSRILSQGDRLAFGPLTAVLDLEKPATAVSTSDQIAAGSQRIEAAEKQLAHLQKAVQEAEAAHGQWLTSIHELSRQHEKKTAGLEDLTAQLLQETSRQEQLRRDTTGLEGRLAELRQQESQAKTAAQQETARQEQLCRESAQAEARLTDLRQQILSLDQGRQESESRATELQNQIQSAEQALDLLSQRQQEMAARHQELADLETKLAQTNLFNTQAEARRASLVQEHQRSEDALRHLQASIHSCEMILASRRSDLLAETKLLEETMRRRVDFETQCQSLANTEQKLNQARERLADLQKQTPTPQPSPASPPTPAPLPGVRRSRIVAIGSPRSNVIPMKSERIIKKNTSPPPRPDASQS